MGAVAAPGYSTKGGTVLEANVEEKACARAKQQGFLCRKLKWIGRRGAPDRLFSRADTGPFFVEFKKPGGTLDPHQVREIKRLREAGFRVEVIDNIPDAYELFV